MHFTVRWDSRTWRWGSEYIFKALNTMSDISTLLKIDQSLVEPAAVTCARAFEDDPMTVWMIPDAARRANLRYAFEMILNIAALGGAEAYATSAACEGVAVWMPAGMKQTIGMLLQAGYPLLPLRCGWRYFLLDSMSLSHCEKLRKKYAPVRHCYLAALGVDPAHQGQGFASKLLTPMLERLDADRTACYVETQNLKNVAMYRHFGFELMHETKMPGGDYPLYLMLRPK
jgi:ribosomal protein S18 acetylase RimI-like enzyme